MGLCGLLVLVRGGSVLYSIYADLEYNLDPHLFGGFLSAIQSFSQHLDISRLSLIKGIIMEGIQIKYRVLDPLTFIGIVDEKTPKKRTDLILEYLIHAFLSKFRNIIHQKTFEENSTFRQFDAILLKYRKSKRKDLQRLLDKLISSRLQGIINKIVNFFPISQLVKINPNVLTLIGNKVIWVDVDIELEEEERIINVLRTETKKTYGSRVFELIEREVKEIIEQKNSSLMV